MRRKFSLSQWARPEMLGLKPYTSARDTFTASEGEWVFLDANENPYDTGLNRYPDPNQTELKKQIAALRGCTTSQLLIGNGSDEILDLIFRAFCAPNQDEILLMPPTYGMYSVLANINGIGIKEVPLDQDFQLRPKEILDTVTPNTKALFFCSPNNPSGNCFRREDIMALLNGFEGIIVIDEAYVDFTTESSWIDVLGAYPNVIITQTLSKAFGLAGLRLGIAIAHPEIISLLHRIKPPYNINILSQQTAISALKESEKVRQQVAELIKEREKLETHLAAFSWVEKIYPSDANFILIKVDDAEKRYSDLLSKNVVVRSRSTQYNCENCLRISVGTAAENKLLLEVCKTLTT